MDPGTLAMIASTALSGFGAYNQYEAGKDASKEAQALTAQQMGDERNRSAAEQAERRARAAASGIQFTGSSKLFMDQAKKQDASRLNWMKKTGDARADSLESQGTAGALGSLSNIPGYWV